MSAIDGTENRLTAGPPLRKDCSHCGANCWEDDQTCWHCHRILDGPPSRPRFGQFSIGMVLLVTTALSLALGTVRWLPLVSGLLLAWFLPAIVHTYLACRILRNRVPPISFGERIDRFGLALVYAIAALMVGAVTGLLPAILLVKIISAIVPNVTSQLVAGIFVTLVSLTAVLGVTAGMGMVFWFTLPKPPTERSAPDAPRKL